MVANPFYRMRLAIGLYIAIMAIGSIGYRAIEHWSILDSVFMTVITLSGVGFGEIHDLDYNGKIFTILLIVFGVSTAAWALVTTFEVLGSEQGIRDIERRRIRRMVNHMKDHFIICGYGRIGRSMIEGYQRSNFPFVVIELSDDRVAELRAAGVPYILGDASNDDILQEAGISRAKALIAVTPNDAVNTYIIMSAKWLNPDLMVVVRAINPDSVGKLYRAGATKVISPHIIGGWWMALTAINPATTDFIEGLRMSDSTEVSLYEFVASETIEGKTFAEMNFKRGTGALVVAIKRTGEFIPNPPDRLRMKAGDAVIAMGSVEQLRKVAAVVNPENPEKVYAGFATFDT
jgi:voltage-gated potassium channel